jgi:hypothetical protein
MRPVTPILRLLGHAASLLLAAIAFGLVYGHLGGGAQGLSLVRSYITEYQISAPHWPWIVLASFCFAVLLMLLAIGFLVKLERSPLVALGSVMLAAAAMAMFFVSYAPVRLVEQPKPPAHRWWTPRWWITSQTARTPEERGMARAYSDVHYHAIKLALVNGLLGMIALALSQRRITAWRKWSRFTIISAFAMAGLFVAGDRLLHWHGLWQRMGFALMYLWLWSAGRRLRADDRSVPREAGVTS